MSNDTYQIVTDRVISKLQEGTIPWKHYTNLRADQSAPRNLVSQRPYNGINYFLLSMMGYQSPHWLTYNQAKGLGGNVRKGEKSTPIVFWKFIEVKDPSTDETKRIPLLRYFNVFNSEQVEGIEAKIPELPEARQIEVNAEADRIVNEMQNCPGIEYGAFATSSYSPSEDKVRMTKPELCVSDARFHEVRFHELVHSTGHKSRLDRGVDGLHAFGSKEYSREELVAEMGSAFLCSEVGLSQETIEDSAAYIQNWLGSLKNDPKLVVQAAGKAQKAAAYILNRDQNKDLTSD